MIRRTLSIVTALLLLGACGVSGSSSFDEIDPADLPDRLNATTTTTTTTTTTIPSTSTTDLVPDETTTTVAQTSTTVVATELVAVFFVLQRQIVRLEVPLPIDPVVAQVIPVLEEDPSSVITPGIRTAVPAGLMSVTDVSRGVVTVDLAPTFFDNPEDSIDPTLAIAQIVMTLTRLSGISEVKFTQNGEPTSVPLADSSLSAPDQQFNYEDYEALLTSPPPPVTIETTTTTIASAPVDSGPVVSG